MGPRRAAARAFLALGTEIDLTMKPGRSGPVADVPALPRQEPAGDKRVKHVRPEGEHCPTNGRSASADPPAGRRTALSAGAPIKLPVTERYGNSPLGCLPSHKLLCVAYIRPNACLPSARLKRDYEYIVPFKASRRVRV